MIGLVVKMTVQPDQTETFEAVMKDMMAKVKANEPGCLIYQLYRSPDEIGSYVMMEQYASKDALDAHNKTEHMAETVGKLGACLAGAPVIQQLDMVE